MAGEVIPLDPIAAVFGAQGLLARSFPGYAPREGQVVVRGIVRHAAWNYGALEPGDSREGGNHSSEGMRDEILWCLDAKHHAGRKR